MYWLIGTVALLATIALAYVFMRRRVTEDQRILTFAGVYSLRRLAGATSREAMETVCELHIPPGKGQPLEALGVTGRQYLDGVFGDQEIQPAQLIAHLIRLEFPRKYPPRIDLAAIRASNRGGPPTPVERLDQRIAEIMRTFPDRAG